MNYEEELNKLTGKQRGLFEGFRCKKHIWRDKYVSIEEGLKMMELFKEQDLEEFKKIYELEKAND